QSVRHHPAAADHREVDPHQGDAARGLLRGAPGRHQARDQEGRGDAVRRQGGRRAGGHHARQGQAPGPLRGPAPRLEEGLRRPEEGREDDRVLRAGITMALKQYNPTSPGRRFMSTLSFEDVTKHEPEKALTEPKRRTGGRNNKGRQTVWFRGGGHKKRYRIIDFRRDKHNVPAKVAAIEYDPNRSARIALLHYADGEKRYILAPDGLKVGQG